MSGMDRRTFIKTTVVGGAAVSAFGFQLAPDYAQTQALKIARTTETRSTCPYCSVSCGVIIHTLGDKAKNATPQVVHVEGDPDHPINRGTLCPKGASLEQDILNDRRLLKPQVRRPGSDHWEDISWDDAIGEIARKVKDSRDQTFVEKDDKGNTVNRCEGIGLTRGLRARRRPPTSSCKSARARTSLSWAASSTTPSRTTASPTIIWSTTPTLLSSSKTASSCPKTDCSPASTPEG